MKDILISHSSIDAEISLKLFEYLSEHKIDCWIDAKLKAGPWTGQIGKVLEQTNIVIMVVSEASIKSKEVIDEVMHYINVEGRLFVPFVIDKDYYLSLGRHAGESMPDAYYDAVYKIGSNKHEAVFWDGSAETLEQAFDRLVHILPRDVSRLANNPAHFIYAEGGDSVLKEYKGQDQCVTVPSYVEEICAEAFMCNGSLRKVIVPDSVKTIGRRAFFGCKELLQVEGMRGVTEVGQFAFDESGVAPNEESNYSYGGIVFKGKVQDGTLTVAAGTRIIANESFRYCNAREVVLPNGLQYVGKLAFADGCRLERITIPASVKALGKSAFKHCNALKEVVFEGEIPEGAEQAFDNLQKLIKTEDK